MDELFFAQSIPWTYMHLLLRTGGVLQPRSAL